MPTATLNRAPDLLKLPIAVNPRAISLAEGIRAGLSVAFLVAISEYLHDSLLREAALAALLTCICDSTGPIHRRLPVLIGFTLTGAAVTFSFGLLRNFGPAVALPLGVFGLFCATFIRIYGQAPQQLGGVLSAVMILSLDTGTPSLELAALLAASFIGGGLWAILLTLVIWRVHPFLPARRAVAEVYRALSELVRDLHTLTRAQSVTDAAWESHARIYRRKSREAIEEARTIVLGTLRARGVASNRAAQAIIRLETAEQVFAGLIALSELLEHAAAADRQAAERVLRRLRPVLLLLGRIIISDDTTAHARIDRALGAVAVDLRGFNPDSGLRTVLDRIFERLRIAQTLAVPANFRPGVDAAGRPLPLRQRLIPPLQANLTWKSPTLRHAVRAASTAAPALAITMAWFTPYDHWLTITIVATLQPYFSLAYTRAIERIVGTALGGVVAAGIGLVCTDPISMAAGLLVLSVLCFAIRSVSFGLFMLGLTPLVVLLIETGTPQAHSWAIAAARAGLTALGGVIAVIANFLLWPAREPALVAPQVKATIAAHADWAEADLTTLLEAAAPGQDTAAANLAARDANLATHGSGIATHDARPHGATPHPSRNATPHAARGDAGVATNTLEAMINRALLNPGAQNSDSLDAAMAIDAALRRFAGRLVALQHDGELGRCGTAILPAWRSWIVGSLRQLANGQTDLPPRPAGAPDTLTRIARQIELMAGAMERLR